MQLARISIDEVKTRLDQNEALVFLDARRSEAWQGSTVQLPGALRVPPGEVEQCLPHLPYNRPIIPCCSCPGEASSARVAEALRARGFVDIHALFGGFDAWQQTGYPLEPKPRSAEERLGEVEEGKQECKEVHLLRHPLFAKNRSCFLPFPPSVKGGSAAGSDGASQGRTGGPSRAP